MPFCQPPEGVKRIANMANLGTVLMGLRIENSAYNFSMMVRPRNRQSTVQGHRQTQWRGAHVAGSACPRRAMHAVHPLACVLTSCINAWRLKSWA